MKRIYLIMAGCLLLTFCKGPGSGPLVKESFDKTDREKAVPAEKHMGKVVTSKIDIKIEPCADCVTIARLLENRKSYEGKVIRVKGQVTKFNGGILGRNWIHIQDGTEYDEGFDLTVTTGITAQIGETIIFEGKIALDKDFGYGYSYDVIMEDAVSVQ